jgi:hypothetical protein
MTFFTYSESSKENGKRTGIELHTSTAEVVSQNNETPARKSSEASAGEKSRPPVQSEHPLCHAEQSQDFDSIPPDAGRKEITFANQSGVQIPELTEVKAGTEKTEPDSQDTSSKFYENLAFVGKEAIDLDTDIRSDADHRQQELLTKSMELDSAVRGGAAMKQHIMPESSSISDEELVEVEEVERKFVTRESLCPDSDNESDLSIQRTSELLVAAEVKHAGVCWEETSPRQDVKAVVLKRVSNDSSEEDSSLSLGKATIVAHEIVERVIEEAKVKSLHSSPDHGVRTHKSLDKSNIMLAEDAKALAEDIVQNVIEEVRRRLSFQKGPDHTSLRSPVVKHETGSRNGAVVITESTPSPSSDHQVEVRMRTSGSSVDRDKESGSGSDAHYHSCETSDARSPSYSRPVSGEVDFHLFPGHASSLATGSSEYETCATSQGSTNTFASALASQDTSYATARSSLSSQQSSRTCSTLEPDSEPESSGHPGDLSSEASETIIPGDDRDLATPTLHDMEADEDGSHDSLTISDVREPYDLPISEEVIRGAGHEGPFMGHLISGAHSSLTSVTRALALHEDEPPSVSEGTWHSSSVRTAIPGSREESCHQKSDPDDSSVTVGQGIVQQNLVSPISIEGSVASIDLTPGGGSQLSQSSVR